MLALLALGLYLYIFQVSTVVKGSINNIGLIPNSVIFLFFFCFMLITRSQCYTMLYTEFRGEVNVASGAKSQLVPNDSAPNCLAVLKWHFDNLGQQKIKIFRILKACHKVNSERKMITYFLNCCQPLLRDHAWTLTLYARSQ